MAINNWNLLTGSCWFSVGFQVTGNPTSRNWLTLGLTRRVFGFDHHPHITGTGDAVLAEPGQVHGDTQVAAAHTVAAGGY